MFRYILYTVGFLLINFEGTTISARKRYVIRRERILRMSTEERMNEYNKLRELLKKKNGNFNEKERTEFILLRKVLGFDVNREKKEEKKVKNKTRTSVFGSFLNIM